MDQISVEHIKKRLREGDTSCFTPLVNDYKDLVYNLALKISRSPNDAEEIAQDVFVKAFKSFQRFRGQSKLSTWLYQITYTTALNHLRKKKVETVDQTYVEVEADEHILQDIQLADKKRYIEQALTHLKPSERGVIELFYLQEQSIEEVTQITQLSRSNVKVLLHRSKKKLYGILEQLLKNELNSLV